MKEQLYAWLIPVVSAIAGLISSGAIIIIVKKIIKVAIQKFIKEVLTPKTKEVLPNKQLDRIEKTAVETKNEILELRGKK